MSKTTRTAVISASVRVPPQHRSPLDLLQSVFRHNILDEMVRVLPRLPRITLSPAEIRDLADSFLFLADIVEPSAQEDTALRDQADQAVLATLKASKADYLITGDKDLLSLADRYPIITPAEFWERHGS